MTVNSTLLLYLPRQDCSTNLICKWKCTLVTQGPIKHWPFFMFWRMQLFLRGKIIVHDSVVNVANSPLNCRH